jgi:transcriptional regulator with PAS, ATPase and Fis domain
VAVTILNLGHRRLVVADPKMADVIHLAKRAAKTLAPVFLCGESGSGKELIARYIHMESARCRGGFVSINCAAVPDGLMESELFGHERGAFTGAISQYMGKFERASGGTLLLDEVSEMSVHLQAKLLRVLQEGEVDRLGGREGIPVNCRVISTTNRDPRQSILCGQFREDLFYRLNVIRIDCPPLRGREEAIEALAYEFLKQSSERQNKDISRWSKESLKILKQQAWSGNVRELQNVIERAVLLCDGNCIEAEHLESWLEESQPETGSADKSMPIKLEAVERQHILSVLRQTSGNRTEAAEELGISVRTLRNKLKVYQVG